MIVFGRTLNPILLLLLSLRNTTIRLSSWIISTKLSRRLLYYHSRQFHWLCFLRSSTTRLKLMPTCCTNPSTTDCWHRTHRTAFTESLTVFLISDVRQFSVLIWCGRLIKLVIRQIWAYIRLIFAYCVYVYSICLFYVYFRVSLAYACLCSFELLIMMMTLVINISQPLPYCISLAINWAVWCSRII